MPLGSPQALGAADHRCMCQAVSPAPDLRPGAPRGSGGDGRGGLTKKIFRNSRRSRRSRRHPIQIINLAAPRSPALPSPLPTPPAVPVAPPDARNSLFSITWRRERRERRVIAEISCADRCAKHIPAPPEDVSYGILFPDAVFQRHEPWQKTTMQPTATSSL